MILFIDLQSFLVNDNDRVRMYIYGISLTDTHSNRMITCTLKNFSPFDYYVVGIRREKYLSYL